MSLTHPKRSILLISVGCDQKTGERDNAITQINTFLRDWLCKGEHPMTLLNCLGSVVGLRVGSLDNTKVEVVDTISARSVSQDWSQMNNALRLLPEGDNPSGSVLCQS